jgi:hypothetical protein
MSIDFDSFALAPCIGAFGETVTYQPGAGAPVTLNGIFDEYASDDKINGDGEVRQVIAPVLSLRIADLAPGAPLPCRNEAMIVRGATWQIAEASPDSFGALILKLRRVQS